MTRCSPTFWSCCSCFAGALLWLLAGTAPGASLDDEYVTWKRHWAVTGTKFEISAKRFRLNKNLQHPRPVILIHGLLVDSRFPRLRQGQPGRVSGGGRVRRLEPVVAGHGPEPQPAGLGQEALDPRRHPEGRSARRSSNTSAKIAGTAEVFVVGYELGGVIALAPCRYG